ncbi:MAG: DegT/DnrJ/EryC1/StrS family aminotransferase [Bacteriovoracaceae bacterium]|nr:DegT/DnrJ/EryC1/StrS family aminotransferase [Bacteriovoracaceae bacterium]
MEKKLIPVSTPFLSGKEASIVSESIGKGWISSGGPYILEFEDKFKKLNNRLYASSCSSGTAALILALQAIGIKEGDEVIVPNFTIISCAQAVIEAGAKPVFVDCDPHTYNMDTSKIEAKINKSTKAIMAVHIYGLSCDIDPILELAKKYNLKIIEDAAQAHGQTYKGKPCGSFGDVSVFSFYANKHITTGEGGMVLTDDLSIFKKVQSLKNLCFNNHSRFKHEKLGYNFRMTSLQAAFGIAQIDNLPKVIETKKAQADFYMKCLGGHDNLLQLPIAKNDFCDNHYWVFPIVFKKEHTFPEVSKELKAKGIETRPFFYPLSKQPALKKYSSTSSPMKKSEGLYEKGIYLPMGPHLTEEKINYICDCLLELIS